MADLTTTEIIIFLAANFFAMILSGMAGGGGGFINTPLLIFLGLTPAQAVATGKFSGLSSSVTSIGGMKEVKIRSKRQVAIIMAMALVIGLVAPLVITNLDDDLYRKILGFMLLAMIPVLIWKRVGHTEHQANPAKRLIGYTLLIVSLCLQAFFSGGLGSLVNIVLMAFLGLSALEANLTKRYSQVVLNSVIVLGVSFSGLIVWPIALGAIVSASIGSYIGSRIASKRGNRFVMTIFIILMFVSSMELLFG